MATVKEPAPHGLGPPPVKATTMETPCVKPPLVEGPSQRQQRLHRRASHKNEGDSYRPLPFELRGLKQLVTPRCQRSPESLLSDLTKQFHFVRCTCNLPNMVAQITKQLVWPGRVIAYSILYPVQIGGWTIDPLTPEHHGLANSFFFFWETKAAYSTTLLSKFCNPVHRNKVIF